MKKLSFGLVAHDMKKDLMVQWCIQHQHILIKHHLYATGTTGGRILEACPDFKLTRLKSGPLGGDQQLGAMIADDDRRLDALFFFTDPMASMPHDVDVKALIRLSTLYNIPLACNEATANMVLTSIDQQEKA